MLEHRYATRILRTKEHKEPCVREKFTLPNVWHSPVREANIQNTALYSVFYELASALNNLQKRQLCSELWKPTDNGWKNKKKPLHRNTVYSIKQPHPHENLSFGKPFTVFIKVSAGE